MEPINPQDTWPVVSTPSGKTPLSANSPLAIYQPQSNPWSDYMDALAYLSGTPTSYAKGFLAGWSFLGGGAAPDVAVAKACKVIETARIQKLGAASETDGRMDVWRLFSGESTKLNVDLVIAAIGT